MKKIYEKVGISRGDYDELNSGRGRWTKETYAYWAAKFKSGYPAEGYGLFDADTCKDNGEYYITWGHYDSCD